MHTLKQVNIKASSEKLIGVYSNLMEVSHASDEFILDFLNIFPPSGTLNARVIVSPAHFKRMIRVMEESLKKFEEQHGGVAETEITEEYIGFQG